MKNSSEYRRTLGLYTLGLFMAAALTAIPFIAVVFTSLHGTAFWWLLYSCAGLQVIVHFRCFLHISLARSHRHDLWLLLFTALITTLMVAGTFWVFFDQMSRMSK